MLDQHPELISVNETFWTTLRYRHYCDNIDSDRFIGTVVNAIPSDKKYKENVSFEYCTEHLKQFIGTVSDEQHFLFIKNHFNKLVVIRRKNLLKQFVSYAFAVSNDQWHWYTEQDNNFKRVKLPLVVSRAWQDQLLPNAPDSDMSLIDFLTTYQNYINGTLEYLKNSNIVWLDIVYEDHIEKDPIVAVKMIENFLQVTPYNHYTVPLKKIANSMQQDIINFDEIVNYLKGSEHEWMLQ
jgi:LPS sulfotransferase NodH